MNNGSMHSTQGDLIMAPEKAGASPVPGASPIQAPGEVTGLAFFEAWRAARLLDSHRKPMGAAGLHQAGIVWRQWLTFCAGKVLFGGGQCRGMYAPLQAPSPPPAGHLPWCPACHASALLAHSE